MHVSVAPHFVLDALCFLVDSCAIYLFAYIIIQYDIFHESLDFVYNIFGRD